MEMKSTRGTRSRKGQESEKDSKDGGWSEDVVFSSEDDAEDQKAAVRLHVVVKEPPRLSKTAVESLEDL